MTVYETDVPGVGRKFELELGGGSRAVVLIHHDGDVELFRRDGPDVDSEKLLDLTGRQANLLGSLLEGAHFETVDLDELSVPLGDAIIGWVEVPEDSPVVGATLAESGIRDETGASVIAVQRDGDPEPNPGPDTVLAAGDLLVALGTRREQSSLEELVGRADD